MKKNIIMEDFTKEYLPFRFQGYWKIGYCHLRVCAKDGQVVILASQLVDYHGTSVTNSAEVILERTLTALLDEGNIKIDVKMSLLEKLFRGSANNKILEHSELYEFAKEKIIFIEHYPAHWDDTFGNSWKEVVFSDIGVPSWRFTTEEDVRKLIDEDMLKFDYAVIDRWKSELSSDELKSYEHLYNK